MSLRKSFGKHTAPKQGVNTSLAGFSFKQLEYDEQEHDIMACSQKCENIFENPEKAVKKIHEEKPETSSASSAAWEVKSSEKFKSPGISENKQSSKKLASFLSIENRSSSIKTAAKAKLETSKDFFSGMKDKISKTFEEFSGDSSSNSSPEKEKPKSQNVLKTNNLTLAEKETIPLFHGSASSTELVSSASVKTTMSSEVQNKLPCSSHAHSDSSLLLKENFNLNEMPALSSLKTASQKETAGSLISSGLVEIHPLAKFDVEDDFEDVIELTEAEILSRKQQDMCDDTAEFYDPHKEESNEDILKCRGNMDNDMLEEYAYRPFLTDDQQKPFSEIKCQMKTGVPKDSIFAGVSELDYIRDHKDEHSDQSDRTKNINEFQNTRESMKYFTENKSSSTVGVISQQLKPEDRSLPYQKLITLTVVLFAYLIIPLPSYISGFIMGTVIASVGWALYMWLMEPPQMLQPVTLPQVDVTPPVPEMKLSIDGEEFLYKGWMNELAEYSVDDYHINKTHPIYVSLEASHLRLQRPKNAIPKRAMWDEVLPKPQFIHQRHFDLPGSRVFLLPHGLVRKRIWSKKYPICIALANRHGNDDARMRHVASEPVMTEEKAKLSDMGLEFNSKEKTENTILYLFARTGREKEEWYHRFSAAASGTPLGNHVLEIKRALSQNSPTSRPIFEGASRHKREGSTGSSNSSSSEILCQKEEEMLDLLTFAHYMGRLMPSASLPRVSSPAHTADGKGAEEVQVLSPTSPVSCDSQLFWINALIGRCFFDFLRDKWWKEKVKEKLQRKLSKIHVPYFIEELQVTDIDMGCEVPSIRHASKPYIDERGFWVNLDITYAGGFQMTIETKINLMKLKKAPHASSNTVKSDDQLRSPVTDSDEEDSAESSTDEEEEMPATSEESSSSGGTSKKLLRYLNKITQSKYFQQATEYRVIKRAMENVSNTPLTLSVTVKSLVGKLALNIPPPPSDRLWYGFRGNPHLRLSAKPQVGERAVTFTHIVEWIEKKLAIEFQRVFVIPNMDDLIIPILVPGETSSSSLSHSVSL